MTLSFRGFATTATAAALVLGLPAGAAQAQATTFDCPARSVQAQVTTRLANNWVAAPLEFPLAAVAVRSGRGGNPIMSCRYGFDARNAAAIVEYQIPEAMECQAEGLRFACTRPARTHATGPLEVRQTFAFDLDQGVVGGARSAADVWFQAETNDLLYLEPMNGAELGVGDRSNRGRDGCAAARYSAARVSLRDVPVGSYICARTNQGRISQFRVNGVSRGSPRTLSLGYTTWQ